MVEESISQQSEGWPMWPPFVVSSASISGLGPNESQCQSRVLVQTSTPARLAHIRSGNLREHRDQKMFGGVFDEWAKRAIIKHKGMASVGLN